MERNTSGTLETMEVSASLYKKLRKQLDDQKKRVYELSKDYNVGPGVLSEDRVSENLGKWADETDTLGGINDAMEKGYKDGSLSGSEYRDLMNDTTGVESSLNTGGAQFKRQAMPYLPLEDRFSESLQGLALARGGGGRLGGAKAARASSSARALKSQLKNKKGKEEEEKKKEGTNVKKKKKLECGQSGKYKDLKSYSGDNAFDRDHIPSKGALKEFARRELNNGEALTEAQAKAIDDNGHTIAIPKKAHQEFSPTYGQTPAAAAADSKDLAGSAKRDIDAMEKNIDKHDPDGKCKEAYKKAAEPIRKMTNADYKSMLQDIMSKAK